MSSSTLTNLTRHPADRASVDVDVTIALDTVRAVWLGPGGQDGTDTRDPDAGARMLGIEHRFLAAMHGEDYHLLPRAAAVLHSPVVPS